MTPFDRAKSWWESTTDEEKMQIDFPGMYHIVYLNLKWEELETDERWAVVNYLEARKD